MSHFLLFLIGIVAGIILRALFELFRKEYGILEINYSDPEKDTYNLIVGDLDSIATKKEVLFRVTHK